MGTYTEIVTLLLYLYIAGTYGSTMFRLITGYKFSGAVISSTHNVTKSRCTQLCVSQARNADCLGVNFVENELGLGTCEVCLPGSTLTIDASTIAMAKVDPNASGSKQQFEGVAVTSNLYNEFNAPTEANCWVMCQFDTNCKCATYTTSGACKLSSDEFYSLTATSVTEVGSVVMFAASCPSALPLEFGDGCYYLHTGAMDQATGNNFCKTVATNTFLWSPDSEAENTFVCDHVVAGGPAITAITGTYIDRFLKWRDLGKGIESWTQWYAAGNEPNGYPAETVLQAYCQMPEINYPHNDAGASAEGSVMCEMAKYKACPAGYDSEKWREFGSCYKFVSGSFTYDQAKAHCLADHAYSSPIIVDSQAEGEWAATYAQSTYGVDRFWTNAVWDGSSYGRYESTGMPLGWAGWCSPQPDSNGGEPCVEIGWSQIGCWNDAGCSAEFDAVCEISMFRL